MLFKTGCATVQKSHFCKMNEDLNKLQAGDGVAVQFQHLIAHLLESERRARKQQVSEQKLTEHYV